MSRKQTVLVSNVHTASTGGNGSDDAGKVVSFTESGGINAASIHLGETGVSSGELALHNHDTGESVFLRPGTASAERLIELPDGSGVLALRSELTGLLEFKGLIDCSGTPNYPAGSVGDYYVVSVAGSIGGALGPPVETYDGFFCVADNAGGTAAAVGSSWQVINGNVHFSSAGLALATAANAAGQFALIKQAASDSATGVVELATDAETVTGTDTARAVTPATLTARLAAPGGIGGTAPAGGSFTTLNSTGRYTNSVNGASAAPPVSLTGTWFTGGGSTNTKPALLVEPFGTSSTSWSNAGTGIGLNAPSGFTGNLLDAKVNNSSMFSITYLGDFISAGGAQFGGTVTNGTATGGNSSFVCSGKSKWNCANTDGLFLITNNAGTGLTRFIFGSNDTSGLSFAKSTTTLTFGLGDGSAGGTFAFSEGANVTAGTTAGTKIGTGTTQKLGFWNATPVVQPTAVADATDAATAISQLNALLSRLRTIGLIAT